jgi:hypothetical protein
MNPFFMEVMDDDMADILRQKTEVERLRIAGRLWRCDFCSVGTFPSREATTVASLGRESQGEEPFSP